MIHTSLPIRPRLNVPCEYLITPISISESSEKKILLLSDLKAGLDGEASLLQYVDFLSEHIGVFDEFVTDSDQEYVRFVKSSIIPSIGLTEREDYVKVCNCGAYEELENVRMFDLRRVKDNHCVFCQSIIGVEKKRVLVLDEIEWPKDYMFCFEKDWSKVDFNHFVNRQGRIQKVSKSTEIFKINFGQNIFGIRYQFQWAFLLVYLSQYRDDDSITIHYVHKVQDKVFFIGALAKIINPKLKITFKALPIVWVKESRMIVDCSPSHIKLMRKALSTKRKTLNVSLKSWRS